MKVLDERARQDVAEASRRAKQRNDAPSHGKVVAELSFGFRRFLVASRYLTSIWMPAARHAFPHGASDSGQRRINLASSLKSLKYSGLSFASSSALMDERLHEFAVKDSAGELGEQINAGEHVVVVG